MARRILTSLLVLLVAASVLPAAVGAQPQDSAEEPTSRIVGGTATTISAHPWQVFMFAGGGACGGSIVHARYVLTAAHCVAGVGPASIDLMVGRSDWRDHFPLVGNPSVFGATKIWRHPSYDPATAANDIAVIKADGDLTSFGGATPIAIDTDLSGPRSGDILTVTGWGTTSFGGSVPYNLRQVKVPVQADPGDRTCLDYLEYEFHSAIMVCAGPAAGGRDSCQGDSGGPAVTNHKTDPELAGITSWGFECALAGFPGVYTRVAPYLGWLAAILPNVFCDVVGTKGDDVLTGTAGDDVICGLAGNDVLRGKGGNDALFGGAGNDELLGSSGTDILFGEPGADILRGALGLDALIGGPGADTIFGAQGGDLVMGDDGADEVSAGKGNDTLLLGPGHDVGRGDEGLDLIVLGPGNDRGSGGKNSDFVQGDGGDDVLFGGDGFDFARGGPGTDTCSAFESRVGCERG